MKNQACQPELQICIYFGFSAEVFFQTGQNNRPNFTIPIVYIFNR